MEYINLIITHLVSFIEHIITIMGPWGISLLMAIESCNIPLPSEAILPFAGYIVSKGEMNIHVAAFAGAFGCVLGSIPSYYLGFFGGRKFVEKYGKEAAWKVDTAFSGTRSNPSHRGMIAGIGVENFHPGALTVGVICGILNELHEQYEQMCQLTGKKATRLTGSGNGIRRNPLMRRLAEEMFKMPMEIPEAHKVPFSGVFWRQGDTGTVLGQREYR